MAKRIFCSYRIAAAIVALIMIALPACTRTESVEYKQVLTGFNGPKQFKVDYIESRASADASWVKAAVPKDKYENILSQIDFGHQAIVAVAVGEMPSASGKVEITRMYQYESKDEPLNVDVRAGIRASDCKDRKELASYPFVLAVFEKPKNLRSSGGWDFFNFDDGCGVEMESSSIDDVLPHPFAK